MGSAFIVLTVQSVPLLCWFPGPFSPRFSGFSLCSFSFSCCQYLVLDVIPLFNVDYHSLRNGRVAERLFP
jgi:hypothetical protein